jgi:hypothetical protein
VLTLALVGALATLLCGCSAITSFSTEELKVTEYGYAIEADNTIDYAFTIENPNDRNSVSSYRVVGTLYDADKHELGQFDLKLGTIGREQSVTYAGSYRYEGDGTIADVKIKPLGYGVEWSENQVLHEDAYASTGTFVESGIDSTIAEAASEEDFDRSGTAYASIVLRDDTGTIIGGYGSSIDVSAGGEAHLRIQPGSIPAYASFETYVYDADELL